MNDRLAPRLGGVLSADVAVPEHEREVRFYSRVLTTGAEPLWREDLMNNAGMPVVGLGERVEAYAHLPLQWMPHVQVADVAASAARAVELGGSELMHGKDDDGNSQWAVLVDPAGAAFGVIPIVPAEAMPPTDGAPAKVGHIAGMDLTVADAPVICDFYSQVVGWSIQDVEMEHEGGSWIDYRMLGDDDVPDATVRHARGANEGLPPVWLLHLPVGDLAESVRRVREEGGEVVAEVAAQGDSPAATVVRDPVGTCVTLVQG